MKLAQAIVKNLESIGVDTVFTGSGQSCVEFLFALHESERIRTIVPRHEQAAAFAACGYAQYGRKLGVCHAASGPGEINLLSGLAVALSDSLPVLSLSTYCTKDWTGMGDLGECTGVNRTPNGRLIFSSITKKAFLIERVEDTCDIVEEAVNLAFAGRPGPVHIHYPYDISAREVPNYRDIALTIPPVLPAPKQIELFADVLARAITEGKKVLLQLGYGCVRSEAAAELRQLVEEFQLPFITTMDGKGILPENHPLSLGITGVSGDPGAKRALLDADLVLAMGNSFAKWATWRFAGEVFANKTLMHINIDPHEINKVYAADYGMVSDIKPAVTGLLAALRTRVTAVPPATPEIEKYALQTVEYTGAKIHPAQLVQELSRNLPENALVFGCAGAHMLWMSAYLQLNAGQRFQNPGSFGPMASMVNGALGTCRANPDRRVIVACGDGNYQMSGFELMTALEHELPIIWIIFNNGGEFGIIKQLQSFTHNGHQVFNQFLNPDFVAFAHACGAQGYRVETLAEFAPVFQQALASNAPVIIDVQIDQEPGAPFVTFDGKSSMVLAH